MIYPSEKADSLEMYVHRTFTLMPSAFHVFAGLRWLERDDRSGFCRTIIKGHRDIADAAHVSKNTVNPALLELQEKGLIELVLGKPIRSEKLQRRSGAARWRKSRPDSWLGMMWRTGCPRSCQSDPLDSAESWSILPGHPVILVASVRRNRTCRD